MTRFALGGKCGKPGNPLEVEDTFATSPRRFFGAISEASAAIPMPFALSPNKWRRVSFSWRLCSTSMIILLRPASAELLLRDRLIHIQNGPGHYCPSCELGNISLVTWFYLA